MKLILKEDLIPSEADRTVFKLAPFLVLVPAIITFGLVPIGGEMTIAGHKVLLQVANPPMGILLLLAMSGISVYGVMLAGWSSGSKYPLLSSVRASAQMISYEAALGMTIVTVVLVTGSLSVHTIVTSQSHGIWHWNLIRLGIVPFVVFIIAITAELNRPPFDVVEAESELVGGFHTEYSSFRFAIFFLAEYMNTITMSAIIVTLFLGGPAGWAPNVAASEMALPDRLVPHQDHRLRLLLHLVPRVVTALPLRPADGPWLEAADPAQPRLDADRRRLPRGQGLGLLDGRARARVVLAVDARLLARPDP